MIEKQIDSMTLGPGRHQTPHKNAADNPKQKIARLNAKATEPDPILLQ